MYSYINESFFVIIKNNYHNLFSVKKASLFTEARLPVPRIICSTRLRIIYLIKNYGGCRCTSLKKPFQSCGDLLPGKDYFWFIILQARIRCSACTKISNIRRKQFEDLFRIRLENHVPGYS